MKVSMGKLTMELIINNMKSQYKVANKAGKSELLDQACQTLSMHRKSVIRLFNRKTQVKRKRPGRKKQYDSPELIKVLKDIWLVSDQICGQRLKMILPEWLPFYEKRHGNLSKEVKDQLKSVSSSTINRLLKPYRLHPKFCTTKPGSLLKVHIPIKTNQWDESIPGFVEADTVAHCGDSLSGDFMWSLTVSDIATCWTENRAIWNKGAHGVLDAIKSIQAALPFKLKGFDSDNGSEFLNYHLMRYFANESIKMTRSRPYHKNDNAHVEQKNWTHVRQLLGYHRYDNMKLVALVNDLYQNEVSLFNNHFMPNFKLISKHREGSKIIKKHDKPKTPYQRVMSSKHIDKSMKIKLAVVHKQLDPFELQKIIQEKLSMINKLVNLDRKQKRKAI